MIKRHEFPTPISIDEAKALGLGEIISVEYHPETYPLVKAVQVRDIELPEPEGKPLLLAKAAKFGVLLEMPGSLGDVRDIGYDPKEKKLVLAPVGGKTFVKGSVSIEEDSNTWNFFEARAALDDIRKLQTREGRIEARSNVARTVWALKNLGLFIRGDSILYHTDRLIPEVHSGKSFAKSVQEELKKVWYQVSDSILVYVGLDEPRWHAYHRYVQAMDILNRKCEPDVPASVKDRLARTAARWRLNLDIITRFGLRHKSAAHASYDPASNEMRITPEYITRRGVMRIGNKFVAEVEKTEMHEIAHAIWHQILGSPEKDEYTSLAPKFFEEIPEDGYQYTRTVLTTIQGDERASEFYTRQGAFFVSDQARNKISDEFAESFVWYIVAKDWFKKRASQRAAFFARLMKQLAQEVIGKADVVLESGKTVKVSDLVDVNLQLSDLRRGLALKAETILLEALMDMGKTIYDIVWIVPHSSFKEVGDPSAIDLVVLIRGEPAVTEIAKDDVHLWITGDVGKADRLVHEFTSPRIVGTPRFVKILKNVDIKTENPEDVDKVLYLLDEVGAEFDQPLEINLLGKAAMWDVLKHHGHDGRALALVETNSEPRKIHVVNSPEYILKATLLLCGEVIKFSTMPDEEVVDLLNEFMLKEDGVAVVRNLEKRWNAEVCLGDAVQKDLAAGNALRKAMALGIEKTVQEVADFIVIDDSPMTLEKARRPKGHVGDKPEVGAVELRRPVQSVYTLQSHQAKKAGRHYDLRIGFKDKAWSWAMRKFPISRKRKMALAVLQPPHSLEYMKWQGIIPEGYGAGKVKLRDARLIDITRWGNKQKTFRVLDGPYKGHYNLIRWRGKRWLLTRREDFRKPIEKQYHPHRLRLPIKKEHWTDTRHILQPKVDGARYLLYVSPKENRLLSRHRHEGGKHRGKHVERTDNVPHIRDIKFDSDEAVIDGEVFIKDQPTTTSVMGSNPGRSRKLQKKTGKPIFVAFDILRMGGADVRKLPYEQRLALLRKVVPTDNKHVRVTPSYTKDKQKVYERLIKQGWEGIVMKDRKGRYGDRFSSKVKKAESWDFVVLGHTPGKGKYKGQIGALKIGRWDKKKKKWVSAGKVGTGINDKTRRWLTKNIEGLTARRAVVQVKGMSLTRAGKVRQPVFQLIRGDKDFRELQR